MDNQSQETSGTLCNQALKPTQPPTLNGMGNEDQPAKQGDLS